MYSIISAGIGALIAIMILSNGAMSDAIGNGMALVLIHTTGLFAVMIVLLSQKFTRKENLSENLHNKRGDDLSEKLKDNLGNELLLGKATKIPWYLFTAGALGVFTVTFNNISFLNIGMSLTLALGLFGQSLAALIVDHYGILGMEKVEFRKKKMIGLGMITIGIVVMTVL